MRVPASFCGVFAHKPTYGLVSQRGLVPPPGFAADLDLAVVGPMARSARDLRLLLSIIAESPIPAQAPPAKLKGLKVALWLDEPTFTLDADTKAVLEAFARRLQVPGAIVDHVACPVSVEQLMSTYVLLLFAITGADLPGPSAAFTSCCAYQQRSRSPWVRMPCPGRNACWRTPRAIANGCKLTKLGHSCLALCKDSSSDLMYCSRPSLRLPPFRMISDGSGGVRSSVWTSTRFPTSKC